MAVLHTVSGSDWNCMRPVTFLGSQPGDLKMKTLTACALVATILAASTPADAKGCLKGALVGGVAGHYAGHHGVLGAAAGCVIGRHEANKRARMERERQSQQYR